MLPFNSFLPGVADIPAKGSMVMVIPLPLTMAEFNWIANRGVVAQKNVRSPQDVDANPDGSAGELPKLRRRPCDAVADSDRRDP
jgi:hypothetical protein